MNQSCGFKTCVGPEKRDWRTILIYCDLHNIYVYYIQLGICSVVASLGGFIAVIPLYKEPSC